jgi:surface carbohydrate biosynthesis protein
MKVLLLYDNFVRDFRGLLLLKALLKARGHQVWLWATWREPIKFAKVMDVDVIVGGQIAETATHHVGKFAKENNIRFVLNSTENVAAPKNFDNFFLYNTTQWNEDFIDLQTIASSDVYKHLLEHPVIKESNKSKYKYIGFPRLDLTFHERFRTVEKEDFRKKYQLEGKRKVYLFISSFLFDDAFTGIPERDREKWNYTEIKKRNADLVQLTSGILRRLLDEKFTKDDVLLIKKHPWDCSGYFQANFASDNCKILPNHEYILPCVATADVVLHTYSTGALEAWILNKPTISIISSVYRETTTLNHMLHELTASNYEEVIQQLDNYPAENPSKKSLHLFAPYLDGKATIRLANEIASITPHPAKKKFIYPLKSRLKARLIEWLIDKGYKKLPITEKAKTNSKLHDFITWENQRSSVIRKYEKVFKKYAQANRETSGY